MQNVSKNLENNLQSIEEVEDSEDDEDRTYERKEQPSRIMNNHHVKNIIWNLDEGGIKQRKELVQYR